MHDNLFAWYDCILKMMELSLTTHDSSNAQRNVINLAVVMDHVSSIQVELCLEFKRKRSQRDYRCGGIGLPLNDTAQKLIRSILN